jgi:protein SCO1/2
LKSFALLVISFSLAISAYAQSDSLASGSRGMRDEYTGKAPAKPSAEVPEELKGVGISEKIGDNLDLSMMVTKETGEKVPLSTFFSKHKPVIISPIYFNCPGLCNFHLNGLVETLQKVDWSPADKFEIVAFSFDSTETSEVAKKKKENYLKLYGRKGTDAGWHFVTADAETVKKLTTSVGFSYKWNETAKEWSHASAAIVVSPEGKISRYLHGIMFEPRDVKLALNEAADGKVGSLVDSVMLFCFKYDSHQSKYGLQVFQLMKLGGALTVVALGLWLGTAMIQAKRENT